MGNGILLKYLIALIGGFVYLLFLGWYTGVNASFRLTLSDYDWTKSNPQLAFYITDIFTYMLPLGLLSFITGLIIIKILRVQGNLIVILLSLPSMFFSIFPYVPIFEIFDFTWSQLINEIAKLLLIYLGFWCSMKKISSNRQVYNGLG